MMLQTGALTFVIWGLIIAVGVYFLLSNYSGGVMALGPGFIRSGTSVGPATISGIAFLLIYDRKRCGSKSRVQC
jgi:hypothetical protein